MLRRVDFRRNIPEEGILHSHRRENLKSYKEFLSFEAVKNILTAELQYHNLFSSLFPQYAISECLPHYYGNYFVFIA
jgi:hypothetical protein